MVNAQPPASWHLSKSQRCTRAASAAARGNNDGRQVINTHNKWRETKEGRSRRYGQWITGVHKWAFLIKDAIHIDPPIACSGSQGFIGVPEKARLELIEKLRSLGRLAP